jgi:hypothetical protein
MFDPPFEAPRGAHVKQHGISEGDPLEAIDHLVPWELSRRDRGGGAHTGRAQEKQTGSWLCFRFCGRFENASFEQCRIDLLHLIHKIHRGSGRQHQTTSRVPATSRRRGSSQTSHTKFNSEGLAIEGYSVNGVSECLLQVRSIHVL